MVKEQIIHGLRYIQGLVDVTWQFLLALQKVKQLENAFVIDATLAKHHFTVDARVAPTLIKAVRRQLDKPDQACADQV